MNQGCSMGGETFLSFKTFARNPDIVCAFSTRMGGKSSGAYAALNLGMKTGDKPETVKKNRKIFFNKLGIPENSITCCDQIHSAHVAVVNKAGLLPETDGLITQSKNIFLTVQTADCFPVFLYDPVTGTVAILHAGWRGTQAGILENTLYILKHQIKIQTSHLLAAIGPGLQKECFEVRKDVYAQFENKYLFPHQEPDKKYLDLLQVVKDRLVHHGVHPENIETIADCTMCSKDKYYSYRRDNKDSGRMIGVIGIRSE